MTEGIANSTAAELRSYVERIERLEIEKREAAEDIADIYKEAKSKGHDVRAMRALIRERRDPDKAAKLRESVDMIREALAGLADLPLGKAAIGRAA